jgi:hypothetical protein
MFEVHTAVVMKSSIFWDITQCNQGEINRRFEGTYFLHLQGKKVNTSKRRARSRPPTSCGSPS